MNVVDVAYCPHCGNTTPQELMGQTQSLHNRDGSHHYFLTRCGTCLEALLYRHVDPANGMLETSPGLFSLGRYTLVWPEIETLPSSVPVSVRKCYAEAVLIKWRAPNAFASQIRRALEIMCRQRGANDRILAHNLRELARHGEIPPALAEATEVTRLLETAGSYTGENDVDPEYVEVIDDFFRAIVEYVYVAPSRMNQLNARLDSVRRSRVAAK